MESAIIVALTPFASVRDGRVYIKECGLQAASDTISSLRPAGSCRRSLKVHTNQFIKFACGTSGEYSFLALGKLFQQLGSHGNVDLEFVSAELVSVASSSSIVVVELSKVVAAGGSWFCHLPGRDLRMAGHEE